MTTMNVKDAAGATVAVEKPLAPGRAAAAVSRPIALATEDKAALDQLHTDLTATIAALAALKYASDAVAIAPSDSTVMSNIRALWIGAGGTVVATLNGVDYTFA